MSVRDMVLTHLMVRAAYEPDGRLKRLAMTREAIRAWVREDGRLVEKVFPVEDPKFKTPPV